MDEPALGVQAEIYRSKDSHQRGAHKHRRDTTLHEGKVVVHFVKGRHADTEGGEGTELHQKLPPPVVGVDPRGVRRRAETPKQEEAKRIGEGEGDQQGQPPFPDRQRFQKWAYLATVDG